MDDCAICTPKSLPSNLLDRAAKTAIEINPLNAAPVHRLSALIANGPPLVAYISVLTSKYWHTKGVRLTVGFLDNPPADLRARILLHMNAWSTRLNVAFVESKAEPMVRIARAEKHGYASYVGTDILHIPAGEPTMNLEAFTMKTPESEFVRVVRHETGHTLGCPHEHMRRELVERIDRQKAITFFQATQGWSEEAVVQQVLTPIEEGSLWGTGHSDPNSIMCYQIPGAITKDGKPIPGGTDIDEQDFAFLEKIYPKTLVAAGRPDSGREPHVRAAVPLEIDYAAQVARLERENSILKQTIGIFARDQA
ncbi:M12 family metallopeptidase [Bradyrhizobium sp. 2TAF24]|uniref:M12 family metallopeptidase n=1 Tax=Bradyrhizobium sp. 2TAF24 TaxID=3233011 RepID=UPI003F936BD9